MSGAAAVAHRRHDLDSRDELAECVFRGDPDVAPDDQFRLR